MMEYEFYWESDGCGGARLLRVFGITPVVFLPEQIGGLPLTEIGAYCFAATAHLPDRYLVECVAEVHSAIAAGKGHSAPASASGQRELSGAYVACISIPGSVRRVGNFAFYNCTSLEELSLGVGLTEIGSDAFMNCKKLNRIRLRGGCRRKSGMRQILRQISSDMEVFFEQDGAVEAALLFPDYYESYDEIAPAHLFGRNIEGEGFRARQCFKDGIPDFVQYDAIFPKACAEEKEQTLCRMAMNRLRYPVDLREEARARYENYVRAHASVVCAAAVREKNVGTVWFLCQCGLLKKDGLEMCVRLSVEAEWAEGTASFLRFVEEFFPQRQEKDRYAFDDF